MATKVFLDTSIILDLLDDKRAFHEYVLPIYLAIESGEIDGYISESVLTSADYVLTKMVPREKRNSIWQELLETVQIIPCTTKLCKSALQVTHTDFEDALLYLLAAASEMDYFISNDKGLRKLSSSALPVISPKEFLNING